MLYHDKNCFVEDVVNCFPNMKPSYINISVWCELNNIALNILYNEFKGRASQEEISYIFNNIKETIVYAIDNKEFPWEKS